MKSKLISRVDKLAHPPIDVGKQEIGVGDPIMMMRLLDRPLSDYVARKTRN